MTFDTLSKMFLGTLLILILPHQSKGCSDDNELIFAKDYRKSQPPAQPNKTLVEVTWWFENFDDVDDSRKKFTFTAWINLQWQDNRIKMKPGIEWVQKPMTYLTCIWAPNIYFSGMVSLTHVDDLLDRKYISMKNVGNDSIKIRVGLRLQIKINCPEFHFHWFPLDTQFCSVILIGIDRATTLKGQIMYSYFNDIQHAPLEYDVSNRTLVEKDVEIFSTKRGVELSYFGTRLSFDRRLPPYLGYLIFSEIIVLISWLSY